MVNFGRVLVFIVAVLLSGTANSQTATRPIHSTNNSATPGSKVLQEESEEIKTAKQQIRLLEAQLQMTKDYQSSLLDTVYWALAGVFVVVGLLLGFGWFANFKVYERDRDALRSDLDATVRLKVEELSRSISTEMEAVSEKLDARIDGAVTKSGELLKQMLAAIDSRVLTIELSILKEKMENNPSDNMALTDALMLLSISAKRKPDDVPNTIHFMLKKIDKGGKLTAKEITNVNAILDSLPPHYKALTDRLREKLVASDIFDIR